MGHYYRGIFVNDVNRDENAWTDDEVALHHWIIDQFYNQYLKATNALSEISNLGLQAQARSNLGINIDFSDYYTKTETNNLLNLKSNIKERY